MRESSKARALRHCDELELSRRALEARLEIAQAPARRYLAAGRPAAGRPARIGDEQQRARKDHPLVGIRSRALDQECFLQWRSQPARAVFERVRVIR